MHWFGSNTAVVLSWIAGGLCVFGMSLARGRAAEGPPTTEQGGAGARRTGKDPEWGARLNVAPNGASGASGAQKGSAASAGANTEPPAKPAPLVIPLVQGFDSFGLNVPDHDLDGRLRSLFVIGAISRLDDTHVEIRESFLETYAEDGSPEFSLELPKATLDRFTRVLVAQTPVTLRKADFELKGASLEFNTVTKEGGLGGPVQMTIYNGGTVAAPAKSSSAPSDTAAPSSPR
jgi:hypothetical protein